MTGNAKIQGKIPGQGDGKYAFRNALNRANQDALVITHQFAQHYAECCGCCGRCCKPCHEIDLCLGENVLSKWGDSPHTWVQENRVEWQRSWPYQCGRPMPWDKETQQPQPTTCKIGCCIAIRCHGCITISDYIAAAPFDQFTTAAPMCMACTCFRDVCGCSGTVGLMRPCPFPMCCFSRPAYIIADVHDPEGLASTINAQKKEHQKNNGDWKNVFGGSLCPSTLLCDCWPRVVSSSG